MIIDRDECEADDPVEALTALRLRELSLRLAVETFCQPLPSWLG